MITFASDFFTSKTTLTCLVGVLSALIAYLQGSLDGHATVGAVMFCLIKMFERDTTGKLIDETTFLAHVQLDKLKTEEDAK